MPDNWQSCQLLFERITGRHFQLSNRESLLLTAEVDVTYWTDVIDNPEMAPQEDVEVAEVAHAEATQNVNELNGEITDINEEISRLQHSFIGTMAKIPKGRWFSIMSTLQYSALVYNARYEEHPCLRYFRFATNSKSLLAIGELADDVRYVSYAPGIQNKVDPSNIYCILRDNQNVVWVALEDRVDILHTLTPSLPVSYI